MIRSDILTLGIARCMTLDIVLVFLIAERRMGSMRVDPLL